MLKIRRTYKYRLYPNRKQWRAWLLKPLVSLLTSAIIASRNIFEPAAKDLRTPFLAIFNGNASSFFCRSSKPFISTEKMSPLPNGILLPFLGRVSYNKVIKGLGSRTCVSNRLRIHPSCLSHHTLHLLIVLMLPLQE